MKYALIQIEPLKVMKYVSDPNLELRGGFKVVPIVKESPPSFDMMTEKLEKSVNVTIDAVTESWTIVPLSESEIKRIDFANKIASGYAVPNTDIVLALNENDINAFSTLLTLIKEAIELGQLTENDVTTISDINGNLHEVTVSQLRLILLGYGFYYKTIWDLSK